MEIVDLKHSDDLIDVVRKCNANFKQLAFSISQDIKRQGRTSTADVNDAIIGMRNELDIISGSIAGEIAAQVSAQVASQLAAADIPVQVAAAMPAAFPPTGAYIMSQSDPAASYAGTSWARVGTMIADGGTQLPLWQRTA